MESLTEEDRAAYRKAIEPKAQPDNAHDAAVERVALRLAGLELITKGGKSDSLIGIVEHADHDAQRVLRDIAACAIRAYKQGLVTDETLWAEYKAKRERSVIAEEAVADRRSVYGSLAR